MQIIYDSEDYCVLHLQAPVFDASSEAVQTLEFDSEIVLGTKSAHDASAQKLVRHGFEIVDKRAGKEVYLDGSWAELFQEHINHWQHSSPTQDEVESLLESYAALASHSVVVQ